MMSQHAKGPSAKHPSRVVAQDDGAQYYYVPRGESGYPWFTADQLMHWRLKYGFSEEEDRRRRRLACAYIAALTKDMRMTQNAQDTACLYIQGFYSCFSFRVFQYKKVCCAALFLAGKVCDNFRRLRDMVTQYYTSDKSRSGLPPQEDIDELREEILGIERRILDVIEYNLVLALPYSSLRDTLRVVLDSMSSSTVLVRGGKDLRKDLAHYALWFAMDSFRSVLCIVVPPEDIARLAVFLAFHYMRIPQPTITITRSQTHTDSSSRAAEHKQTSGMSDGGGGEPSSKQQHLGSSSSLTGLWHEVLYGVSEKTLSRWATKLVQDVYEGDTATKMIQRLPALFPASKQEAHPTAANKADKSATSANASAKSAPQTS